MNKMDELEFSGVALAVNFCLRRVMKHQAEIKIDAAWPRMRFVSTRTVECASGTPDKYHNA